MTEAVRAAWYYAINGAQSGPLSAEEMAALAAAGTVGRDTLVWKEGMATWLAAGQTELASNFAHIPLPVADGSGKEDDRSTIKIGACLGEAFGLLRKYPGPFIFGNIVFMMMSFASIGLLVGAWYAGVMLMVHKAKAGEDLEFGDIFMGFERFGWSLGAGLLFFCATAFGTLFFIIPGFLLGGYLMYLIPLVAVTKLPIGQAIKVGADMVKGHLWKHAFFMFVAVVLGNSGVILCYVGLFLTAPLVPICMAVAFENNPLAPGKGVASS